MPVSNSRPRCRPHPPASGSRLAWRVALPAVALWAGVLATPAAGQPMSVTSPDGLIRVDAKPITRLGAGALDPGLLASSFPGWTVVSGTGAGRGLGLNGYAARVHTNGVGGPASGGGADLSVSYYVTDPTEKVRPTQLQFVQVVSTTGFEPERARPHFDPLVSAPGAPGVDNLPFYWTLAEGGPATRTPDGRQAEFYDKPRAPIEGLKRGPVSFTGDVFAVEWDGATGIAVQDGFRWGYDMTLATDGRGSATFNAPSPGCPPARCTGIGTNAITWGLGSGSPPSGLTFVGANFTPTFDAPFVVGRLSYFNGTIASGTGIDAIDFNAAVAFGFGSAFGRPVSLDARLELINTPNGGVDPAADADIVRFISGGFRADFNVLEGRSESVDLYARLLVDGSVVAERQLGDPDFPSYRLEFAGFGAPLGDGGFVTATPEPATIALVAPAVLLVGGVARRRRASACKPR